MEKPITNQFDSLEQLLTGCVLVIDKPLDWTSFDVVAKIKGRVRNRSNGAKFKIGHAGTLDPLASGVLVICTGKYTKSIEGFMAGKKEYTGTITMGQTTPSFDLETAPEGNFAIDHITTEMYAENARTFIGEQFQTPPVFSAKQVNGVRAYESARAGIEVKLNAVPITIFDFELTAIQDNKIDFRVECSKGTYIRSLANDFGARLNSGSYLSALRRTASYPFTVAESMTIDAVLARIDEVSPPRAS